MMSCSSDKPDEDTGMWVVKSDFDVNGLPLMSIIYLDCIVWAAHLIGVCSNDFFPKISFFMILLTLSFHFMSTNS